MMKSLKGNIMSAPKISFMRMDIFTEDNTLYLIGIEAYLLLKTLDCELIKKTFEDYFKTHEIFILCRELDVYLKLLSLDRLADLDCVYLKSPRESKIIWSNLKFY